MGKALLLGISRCAFNLVVVVVQSNDIDVGELDDLSSRSSNTAANIKHPHVIVQAHLVGEVVLVAGNGPVEALAIGKAAEVETLAPPILVEVGCEVVVVSCEGSILVTTSLAEVRNEGCDWAWDCRTLRVSSVSSAAALLSQCLKYSSTAACWAARSFFNMADMPPLT